MINSDYFFITTYVGGLFFAIVFFVVLPISSYKRGKKINKAGIYASLTLALGGTLFFAYMRTVAYLESGPFRYSNSGMEGVIPGLISLIGIAVTIIGLLWRLIISTNTQGSKQLY